MSSTMVLERTSNLIMPSVFCELDREEMSYVEGGRWETYTGADAAFELTNMVANVVGWGLLTTKLFKLLCGGALSSATGAGAVLALLAGLGMAWSACLCILNSVTTIMAFIFFAQDGGFKLNSFSLFGFGINLVGRL